MASVDNWAVGLLLQATATCVDVAEGERFSLCYPLM